MSLRRQILWIIRDQRHDITHEATVTVDVSDEGSNVLARRIVSAIKSVAHDVVASYHDGRYELTYTRECDLPPEPQAQEEAGSD